MEFQVDIFWVCKGSNGSEEYAVCSEETLVPILTDAQLLCDKRNAEDNSQHSRVSCLTFTKGLAQVGTVTLVERDWDSKADRSSGWAS